MLEFLTCERKEGRGVGGELKTGKGEEKRKGGKERAIRID